MRLTQGLVAMKRASRALVFFDYLSRAIQEAPDRADPAAVASILHASVRHTGYEKSIGVELYLEQANAILDLMLVRGGSILGRFRWCPHRMTRLPLGLIIWLPSY